MRLCPWGDVELQGVRGSQRQWEGSPWGMGFRDTLAGPPMAGPTPGLVTPLTRQGPGQGGQGGRGE